MDVTAIKHEIVDEENKDELSKNDIKDKQAITNTENETDDKERPMNSGIPSQLGSGEVIKLEIEVLEEETIHSPPEQRRSSFTDLETKDEPEPTEQNLRFSKLVWDKWIDLKESLSVQTHSDLALLLIDCWIERHDNSGHEQSTDVHAGARNTDETMYGECEGIEVEINDAASDESTDVDYEELSINLEASREKENDVCPKYTKQMEPDYIVAGSTTGSSIGNICESETVQQKREVRKRNVSDDQTRKVADDQTRKVSDDQTRNVSDDQTRKVSDDQTRKVSDDQTRKVVDDQKRKVADDQKRKVSDDQKRIVSDEQKRRVSHRKRKVVDDQDHDNNGDEYEVGRPKSKKKPSLKNSKDCKEKKLKEVTKKVKKKKIKDPKPKAPWIKVQLFEHEDKYQVENIKSFARMNRGIDAVETLFSCLVCNQFKCASRDIFESHIEKHLNKVLDCEVCQYIGNSEQDIREHKWKCCKRPKRESVCSLCGHWSASSESRRHHLGKVHGIPSWKCMFCSDMFKTRDERKDHMRSEHEEECQYCDCCKLFKYQLSKEDFKAHLESCSSSVPCEICGLLVKTKSMNQHIKSKHENIRKHQCHRCPYAAKTVRRLKTHLLSHDNIHPFKCNLCPFTCIQSNQLKSHMRTHTGEKPYKCTQCKYAAAWNVQLKDHIKVHSILTSVMCQQCDVAFKNERTLNLHMKKEHCSFLTVHPFVDTS